MRAAVTAGVVIVSLMVFAWPRVYVYRIDAALARADTETLATLVDIDAVRASVERSVSRDVDAALGQSQGGFVGWVKERINALGAAAVDEVIDLEWVAQTLQPGPRSFRDRITHSGFEGWNVFVVRLGELGNNPVHVTLAPSGAHWRVVAVYP